MMDWTSTTDRELIDAYADGFRETAFAELVRRHEHMVHATCRRITGSDHDAEDLTQIVFALFADRAPQFDANVSPAGWLSRTAWHVATRMRRDAQRRRRQEWNAAKDTQPVQTIDLDAYELPEALSGVLKELSDPHREIIVLYHFAGFTLPQLAEMTGEPMGTLAGRLSRARAHLRLRLSERGMDLLAVGVPETLLLGEMLTHDSSTGASAQLLTGASAPVSAGVAATAPVPLLISAGASTSAPMTVTGFGALLSILFGGPMVASLSILTISSLTAGGVFYFNSPGPQTTAPVVGANFSRTDRTSDHKGLGTSSSNYVGSFGSVPEPGTMTIAGGTIVALGAIRPRRGR